MKIKLLFILIFVSINTFATVIWAPGYINAYNYGCDNSNQYLQVGFQTYGETNNDYFQIQRTTDPSWSSATLVGARINGCGTCTGRNYSVLDYGPFAPNTTYYYRVQAVSNFTNFSYQDLPQYTSTAPTIVNWVNQVTSSVVIGSTPNSESSYSWGIESRNIQGATISLSPTEISKIFLEQSNYKLNFALDFTLSMTNLDVNIDNGGYFNLYSGSPISNFVWQNASNYITNVGLHQLLVRFNDPVSGIIYYRQYNIYIVPTSQELYKDNYCNTMRVWKNTSNVNGIPLLLSEGFDAYNTKPEQYYREAGKDLINCLLNKGFDIYVINYKYNSQDIRNNAAIFSSAIRYVSSINNNIPIIASGISMGGIINRYACAKAENDGNPLPISKFLTLDAPHQGAVISSDLQAWRKTITTGDLFTEAASNNDAAKELLIYNAYDPTAVAGVTHGAINTTFFNELNNLNGNGYPHLIPTIGVSFSTVNPNPYTSGYTWLYVHVTGVPGNQNKYFQLTQDECMAGSFLPSLNVDPTPVSKNLSGEPVISTAYLSSTLVSILRPFSDPSATITQYTSPTFIPHNSSLDIVNGISKFNITIQPSSTSFHDIIPTDIIEPVVNALINADLYLQNKTITDTKNYIASNKIEAGNNVTATIPVGDFIIENGSNVTMKAGNKIVLSPGFIAKSGSNFIAEITPVYCDGTDATQQRSVLHNEEDGYNTISSTVVYPNAILKDEVKETLLSAKSDNIHIYPNPNNGTFQVTVTKNDQAIAVKEIKVYDFMGRVIWSNDSSNNNVYNIDISEYSQGIYYVRIVNAFDEIEIKKLIKQ